jgi:hypothetical protein
MIRTLDLRPVASRYIDFATAALSFTTLHQESKSCNYAKRFVTYTTHS